MHSFFLSFPKSFLLAMLLVSFLLLIGGGRAALAAENFRVTVLLPVGSEVVQFSLTSQDSREFVQRYSKMPRSDALVPVDDGGEYRGLVLRGRKGQEYRIYNGIAREGNLARRDDLRMLERWVLQHGPADVVRSLIDQLDRQVAVGRDDMAFPLTHHRSASAIIEACKDEGRLNDVARVACLHRALSEQLAPVDYADALEKLVIDPPYMARGSSRRESTQSVIKPSAPLPDPLSVGRRADKE